MTSTLTDKSLQMSITLFITFITIIYLLFKIPFVFSTVMQLCLFFEFLPFG